MHSSSDSSMPWTVRMESRHFPTVFRQHAPKNLGSFMHSCCQKAQLSHNDTLSYCLALVGTERNVICFPTVSIRRPRPK